ncbi:MAG: acyl carrier protein [Oscillospiraceae bacterium]|nr:acyl carrier protein [Oscillospiraceae bacterium]
MVFEKIKKILSEQFDIEEDVITLSTNFVSDLRADSLDVADLLTNVSNEFEVDVESEPIEDFKTVGNLVDFIEKKIKLEM